MRGRVKAGMVAHMVTRKAPVPGGWAGPLGDYRLALLGAGRSPATVRLRIDWLRRFARAVGRGPWEVDTADVIEWSAGRVWARDTRRSALQSVAGFYSWAGRGRAVGVDPARIPTVRASAPAPRPADDMAVIRGRRAEDWRVRLAVRLAAELGLRRGEVARVRTSDLVHDLRGWSLIVHGKGGKRRIVPIGDELADELAARGPGWVFPGAEAGHVSAGWLGRIVARELPAGVTMHSLRHRFATRAYERTGDLVAVQRVLGHESPQTTLRYLAIADESLRAVVESAA